MVANPPYVLKNFIFERPSVEQEQAMLEMFEASLNDQPYDVVRWGKIYKPNNIFFDADGNIRDVKNGTAKPVEVPQTTSVNMPQYSAEPKVVETVAPQPTSDQMQQVLSAIQQAQVNAEAPKTVSSLINQHEESVGSSSPEDTVRQLMAKFVNNGN